MSAWLVARYFGRFAKAKLLFILRINVNLQVFSNFLMPVLTIIFILLFFASRRKRFN